MFYRIFFTFIIIFSNYANANDYQKSCNTETNKEKPNLAIIKNTCSKAGNELEKLSNQTYTWYYLLGNNLKNNTKIKIDNVNIRSAYGNIAHSHVLKGNYKQAKKFYKKWLSSYIESNKGVQEDYKIMLKLYPNKTNNLQKGIEIWNNIYKPYISVEKSYQKAITLINEKDYQKAETYLLTTIEALEKTLNNSLAQADVFSNHAFVLKKLGKWKKSLMAYQQAHKVYSKFNHFQGIKNIDYGIADLYFMQGKKYKSKFDHTKALNFLSKAKNKFSKNNFSNKASEVKNKWIKPYFNLCLEQSVKEIDFKEIELCLSRGGNLNHGLLSATRKAISNFDKYKEVVDFFVKKGADVNTINKYDDTLVEQALNFKGFDVAKLLIGYGAKFDANKVLLHSVYFPNDIETVKFALENGADVEAKDENKNTPLHIATRKIERFKIAKLLLENGADIDVKNKKGETLLIKLAYSDKPKIIKALLKIGANVNAQANDGSTALMNASYKGHLEVVKLLIENGAEINLKDNKGNTALIVASKNWNNEIVRFLLKNKANINMTNNEGYNALSYALFEYYNKSNHLNMQSILFAQISNDIGSNKYINITNDLDKISGNIDLVKILINNGGNPDSKAPHRETLLTKSATIHSNIEIIKILVEAGADINMRGKHKFTPLHNASQNLYKGSYNIVNYLIENGANVNSKALGGHTPLSLAVKVRGNEDTYSVVKLLLDSGSKVNQLVIDNAEFNTSKIRKLLLKYR
jgi:ankyrin repeat protein